MFKPEKLIIFICITSFLLLALSSLSLAQSNRYAQKAEYVISYKDSTSLLTIWMSSESLAYSVDGQLLAAEWRLWQTEYPTFNQVYRDVGYRIEFDRRMAQKMQPALDDIKQLIINNQFVDQASINNKTLTLSSIEEGGEISNELIRWTTFKSFDFADIGDNESDPVLGKIIQQGFVNRL